MSFGTTLVVSFCILSAITATRLLVLDYRLLQAPENDIESKFVYIYWVVFSFGA